jgi:hypothetical protein
MTRLRSVCPYVRRPCPSSAADGPSRSAKRNRPSKEERYRLAVADDDERRALDVLVEHLEVVELEELA